MASGLRAKGDTVRVKAVPTLGVVLGAPGLRGQGRSLELGLVGPCGLVFAGKDSLALDTTDFIP